MAPPKVVDRTEPTVVPSGPRARSSRLPSWSRLPIYLVVSLGLNTTLLTFASQFFGGELKRISVNADTLEMALTRLALRIGVLTAGWKLRYDYMDISYLNILTNAPFLYLITTYYGVSFQTAAIVLAIEIVSTALPTFCLRRRSDIHDPSAPNPQRYLLNSFQLQTATRAFAIAAYVIGIWISLKAGATNLNTYLVSNFEIPTLESAHEESQISLIPKMLAVGWAAQAFLLNPSIGARTSTVSLRKAFDPVTATLADTISHNIWNWSDKTKVLIKQTAVLSVFTWITTVLRTSALRDTNVSGALGYATVWNTVDVIIALFFAWVANT